MPRFWSSQDDTASWEQLTDSLYRIEQEELASYLATHHAIDIAGAYHRFLKKPEKIGADESTVLFREPTAAELDGHPVYAEGAVSIRDNQMSCCLVYESDAQEFAIAFSGRASAVSRWAKTLAKHPHAYCSTFLYVLNRHRAASAIQEEAREERDFFTSLRDDFQGKEPAAIPLAKIAEAAGFEEAVCCIYGSYTEVLFPIASTYPDQCDVRLASIPSKYLTFWDEILTTPSICLVKDLAEARQSGCNCPSHFTHGETEMGLVRIGSEPSRQGTVPRAVLCLYRNKGKPLTPVQQVRLQYAARELAGWIDEIDERIEHEIMQRAIKNAQYLFAGGMSTLIDTAVFDAVLTNIGREISDTVNSHIVPHESSQHVDLTFMDREQGFGNVAKDISDSVYRTACTIAEDGLFLDRSDPDRDTIFYVRPLASSAAISTKRMLLVVCSRSHELAVLRPRLFVWLFDLCRLIYGLVQLEQQRQSFVQRTIHEIRHPMQGLITIGSEVQRLLLDTRVSRKQIAHFAEDIETSVMRLRNIMATLGKISGLEKIAPRLRPILLEADILRPMRRLMGAYARKRRITIGETKHVGNIGRIRSDAEYISLVFYNILDNAVKYSHRDSEIDVMFSEGEDYYVDITNRGPAISSDDKESIFEPGYRGTNVISTEGGLGFGLFMARTIAQELDCNLTLHSTGQSDGKVTFRLEIPKALTVKDMHE